jgi:hypothetical protein
MTVIGFTWVTGRTSRYVKTWQVSRGVSVHSLFQKLICREQQNLREFYANFQQSVTIEIISDINKKQMN